MITLTVNTSKKYDVLMEHGLLKNAGEHICEAIGKSGEGCKICIITDTVVNELYAGKEHVLWTSLESSGFEVHKYVFAGGEDNKNMSTVTDLLEYLADQNFTRSDLLLALGGGITGDITGFAAAVYLRGIEFIQIPTTLLAAVDSSVGGKTGVNLSSGKNLAGAFHQPSLVLFDPDVLVTLSETLKLDGIAEAIKTGIIADSDMISLIKRSAAALTNTALLEDSDFLIKLASMAIEVKKAIVEKDEKENDKRALLNLGHTVAHAIEKCSEYSISHGHAVAMGMATIAIAAEKNGWCSAGCSQSVLKALESFDFPLDCPFSAEELTSAALHDKKRKGDEITLVVPEAIGSCTLRKIPVEDLEKIFEAGLERK